MGKADITLKEYLSDTRRYADLLNGALFGGKEIISGEELSDMTAALSKSDRETVMERSSDLAMKQDQDGCIYAVWLVENQNYFDRSMPVRVMVQEALAYDKQRKQMMRKNKRHRQHMQKEEFLSGLTEEDWFVPVVTLVVYWGEKPWNGAKSLHDVMDFGNKAELEREIRRLVPEYPLHFLDLSKLRHFEGFQSELRILFELYVRKNDKAAFLQYLKTEDACRRLDSETCLALCLLTGAKELEDYYLGREGAGEKAFWKKTIAQEAKKEEIDMCKAITELIEDGRMEGEKSGRLHLLCDLVQEGVLSVKDAARKASMTETDFQGMLEQKLLCKS